MRAMLGYWRQRCWWQAALSGTIPPAPRPVAPPERTAAAYPDRPAFDKRGLEAVMGKDVATLKRLFGEPRLDVVEVYGPQAAIYRQGLCARRLPLSRWQKRGRNRHSCRCPAERRRGCRPGGLCRCIDAALVAKLVDSPLHRVANNFIRIVEQQQPNEAVVFGLHYSRRQLPHSARSDHARCA